jgi:hypothetical protein
MMEGMPSQEVVGTPTLATEKPRIVVVEIWDESGQFLIYSEFCNNRDDDGSFRARVGEALTKALRGEDG